MQKTIKFSDFMAKKHQITGLSDLELQFSETMDDMLLFVSVSLVLLLSSFGLGWGNVVDAFLRI